MELAEADQDEKFSPEGGVDLGRVIRATPLNVKFSLEKRSSFLSHVCELSPSAVSQLQIPLSWAKVW